MGSCYANFGLRKYFGGVPKFPLRDVIENTREVQCRQMYNSAKVRLAGCLDSLLQECAQ